jgi:SAM-dependent methyltransferase
MLEACPASSRPSPPGSFGPSHCGEPDCEPQNSPSGQSSSPERDFARGLEAGALAVETSLVSSQLYRRLSAQDVAEVELRLAESPELRAHFDTAPTAALRRALILAYGLWLGVTAVSEKTGLMTTQPPDDIHAMARGPLAAAGGLYEADLVTDALASVGVEMTELTRALDFGCSSGRVVRALAACYPDVHWYGCDPNQPAIAWAAQNLPGIDFFVNDDAPPLSLGDRSLDLVYAISIWSHFQPGLGLQWLQEMHRLIQRGGHLVMTTHGMTSLGLYATTSLRTPEQCEEILDALYRRGWWYAAEFGEDGDWGVVNPDWGTAVLSPEWVLTELCPRWRLLEFAPGRNQNNQDVYVLQRA